MLLAGAAGIPIDEAVARYRRDGYGPLGAVVDPTDLRRRAEQIMLGEVVYPGLFFQHDSPTGGYDQVPRGKGYTGPSLSYRKIEKLERDPLFLALVQNPLFARIAREVLGPAVSLCRVVLFTKAAQGGTQLPWHQDGGSFWGLSRDPVLQIWTALDDAPVESGCVELVPGSHLNGLATPLGGVIPDDVFAPSGNAARSRLIPARAGESMLLHNHCWHRSGVNRTGLPRRAVTVCYLDAATTCTRKRSPRQFLRVF